MCDALSKTGSSGKEKEKEKFPWYDALTGILGTKPIVDPVDLVKNETSTPSPAESNGTASNPVNLSDIDADGERPIFFFFLLDLLYYEVLHTQTQIDK